MAWGGEPCRVKRKEERGEHMMKASDLACSSKIYILVLCRSQQVLFAQFVLSTARWWRLNIGYGLQDTFPHGLDLLVSVLAFLSA